MNDSSPVDDGDLTDLAAEMVTTAARFVRVVSREIRDDMPAATLRLLSQVEELGPTGVSRLAEADRCSQPTMSAAVSALVERGWASKVAHPDDARATLVSITPEGAHVLRQVRRLGGRTVVDRLDADSSAGHDALVDQVRATITLLRRVLEADPDAVPPKAPDASGPPETPDTPVPEGAR